MEEQFVYIARLVDHNNKFLEGYYKLGMSKQYTIRETQLNSTHLPVDVRMVRVFKTDNMVAIETIFQTCFEDYRVIKKYKDAKNKRTEWYFVDDEEILYGRIDKLVTVLTNVNELNLEEDIKKDTTITKEEREELIKTFRKSKTKLSLVYNGEDLTQENSTDTFLHILKLIAEQSGWDKIMEHEIRVTKTFDELKDRNPSANDSQLKHLDGHYIFTGNNNEVKVKNLHKIIKKLNIKNIQVSIKK